METDGSNPTESIRKKFFSDFNIRLSRHKLQKIEIQLQNPGISSKQKHIVGQENGKEIKIVYAENLQTRRQSTFNRWMNKLYAGGSSAVN